MTTPLTEEEATKVKRPPHPHPWVWPEPVQAMASDTWDLNKVGRTDK